MKKGFTLIELIAVVVILGIILVIAVPRITDVINNARESGYQANERIMVNAARNYLVINDTKNPSEISNMSIITIDDLQDSEFIGSINDGGNSSIECNGYVVITLVEANNYEYEPYLKCGNNYQTEGYGNHIEVEILVVAGGGGGGHRATSSSGSHFSPGGGGAGGIFFSKMDITIENYYNIYVGSGGVGVNNNNGQNGENSFFENLIAIGGGGGGGKRDCNANDGGAGGGGANGSGSCGDGYGGKGIIGQGNDGGGNNAGRDGGSGDNLAGGGGQGGHASGRGGNGGQGVYFGDSFSDNFGENGWFVGGGGGGTTDQIGGPGIGGLGGGGNGALGGNHEGDPTISSEHGTPNTGGGGGGGGSGTHNELPGDGGSGIVLIRYYGEQRANGGNISTFNGYTIHAFTDIGEHFFKLLPK